MNKSFDVFLSHNSKDKPAVREVAEALRTRGLKVWLDEWELVPGRPWQEALEEIIEITQSAAVLVGKDGLGPWQDKETRGCLSEFVDRKLPVIPVLLPGAPDMPRLPIFLKGFTWVDLRGGLTEEGIKRLQWGITGKRPEPAPTTALESHVETNTASPPFSRAGRDALKEKAASQGRQKNTIHPPKPPKDSQATVSQTPPTRATFPIKGRLQSSLILHEEEHKDGWETKLRSLIRGDAFFVMCWQGIPLLVGLPLLVVGMIMSQYFGDWRGYPNPNRVIAGFYYLSTVELGRLLWGLLLLCWSAPVNLTPLSNLNKVIGGTLFLVCLLSYGLILGIFTRVLRICVNRTWKKTVDDVIVLFVLDVLYVLPFVLLIAGRLIYTVVTWLVAR